MGNIYYYGCWSGGGAVYSGEGSSAMPLNVRASCAPAAIAQAAKRPFLNGGH